MPMIGTAPIIDRLAVLIWQQINLTLLEITTSANAVASNADGSFENITLLADDIQPFKDLHYQRPNRVSIIDAGRTPWGHGFTYQNEGNGAGRPRFQRNHRIRIDCVSRHKKRTQVSEDGAGGGWFSVYRHNDRIATAVLVILTRFPKLSVPSSATLPGGLPPLVSHTEILSDGVREEETADDDRLKIVRSIGINVQMEEVWS